MIAAVFIVRSILNIARWVATLSLAGGGTSGTDTSHPSPMIVLLYLL